MIRLATRHHKLMEDRCSGKGAEEAQFDSDGNPRGQLATVRGKLTAAATECDLAGVIFSGDPRGCTAKLNIPNGETNDWGKEGWCIPTR